METDLILLDLAALIVETTEAEWSDRDWSWKSWVARALGLKIPSLDLVIIGWVLMNEGAGTGTCGMALTKGIDKGETNTKLGLDWVIGGEGIEESLWGLWGRDKDVDWGVEEDLGNDVEVELDCVPN